MKFHSSANLNMAGYIKKIVILVVIWVNAPFKWPGMRCINYISCCKSFAFNDCLRSSLISITNYQQIPGISFNDSASDIEFKSVVTFSKTKQNV